MNINISKSLQDLRREKGNTQEELANYLSISIQAVSKWERAEGYPDITLLPKIAAFYGVSVDDLLGVGELRKHDLIKKYRTRALELNGRGMVSEAVSVWREALAEFPEDHEVMSELARYLYEEFTVTKRAESLNEAIRLCEKILAKSTDREMRSFAINYLTAFYKALGDHKKSMEAAAMGGSMYHSKDFLVSEAAYDDEVIYTHYFTGEKITGDQWRKSTISEFAEILAHVLDYTNTVDPLTRHEFILNMLKLLYSDGFYGAAARRVANSHYHCARIYAERGDEKKTREHLEGMARFAKQYETLPQEFTFKSPILNGLKRYNETAPSRKWSEHFLKRITEEEYGSRTFDRYREEAWFKKIIAELEGKAGIRQAGDPV